MNEGQNHRLIVNNINRKGKGKGPPVSGFSYVHITKRTKPSDSSVTLWDSINSASPPPPRVQTSCSKSNNTNFIQKNKQVNRHQQSPTKLKKEQVNRKKILLTFDHAYWKLRMGMTKETMANSHTGPANETPRLKTCFKYTHAHLPESPLITMSLIPPACPTYQQKLNVNRKSVSPRNTVTMTTTGLDRTSQYPYNSKHRIVSNPSDQHDSNWQSMPALDSSNTSLVVRAENHQGSKQRNVPSRASSSTKHDTASSLSRRSLTVSKKCLNVKLQRPESPDWSNYAYTTTLGLSAKQDVASSSSRPSLTGSKIDLDLVRNKYRHKYARDRTCPSKEDELQSARQISVGDYPNRVQSNQTVCKASPPDPYASSSGSDSILSSQSGSRRDTASIVIYKKHKIRSDINVPPCSPIGSRCLESETSRSAVEQFDTIDVNRLCSPIDSNSRPGSSSQRQSNYCPQVIASSQYSTCNSPNPKQAYNLFKSNNRDIIDTSSYDRYARTSRETTKSCSIGQLLVRENPGTSASLHYAGLPMPVEPGRSKSSKLGRKKNQVCTKRNNKKVSSRATPAEKAAASFKEADFANVPRDGKQLFKQQATYTEGATTDTSSSTVTASSSTSFSDGDLVYPL